MYILMVCHCFRGDNEIMRLISARRANRRQAKNMKVKVILPVVCDIRVPIVFWRKIYLMMDMICGAAAAFAYIVPRRHVTLLALLPRLLQVELRRYSFHGWTSRSKKSQAQGPAHAGARMCLHNIIYICSILFQYLLPIYYILQMVLYIVS